MTIMQTPALETLYGGFSNADLVTLANGLDGAAARHNRIALLAETERVVMNEFARRSPRVRRAQKDWALGRITGRTVLGVTLRAITDAMRVGEITANARRLGG